MFVKLPSSGVGVFALATLAAAVLTAVNTGYGNIVPASAPVTFVTPGTTLTVRANVTDPDGDRISYRWAATDGYLRQVDAPSTVWRLPGGAGLHFLYLQARDSHGGYSESRVAVVTDASAGGIAVQPTNVTPPAAAGMTGGTLRTWTTNQVPDIRFILVNNTNPAIVSPVVTSDLTGQLAFTELPAGTYTTHCAVGVDPTAATTDCGGDTFTITAQLATEDDLHFGTGSTHIGGTNAIAVGHVKQADGSVCGTRSALFATESTATVTVTDLAHNVLGGPARVNAYGNYQVPATIPASGNYLVHVQCEGAAVDSPAVALTAAVTPATATATLVPEIVLPNHAPIIASMQAFNGTVQVQLPAGTPTSQPSDRVPASDEFLSIRGTDSRMDACRYYYAVGAVTGCTADGHLGPGITFEQWKKANQLAPYGPNPDVVATFVNTVDLNLTRNHHSQLIGPNHVASYVCNYRGPADSSQAAVDQAIDDALAGRFLVACVAMEYSVTPGVNGGVPFTKFLTFGPSGELLPSINLDGRGEKFTPGNCVACHGGDRYIGSFSTGSAGRADIGAHFLPYDAHNYAFSSKAGLTRADEEPALKALNLIALDSGPTPATHDVINGWYGGCTAIAGGGYGCPNATQDNTYLPPDWRPGGYVSQQIAPDPTLGAANTPASIADRNARAVAMYDKVIKVSCRTCHAAATGPYNLDHPSGWSDVPVATGLDITQLPASTPAAIAGDRNFGRVITKLHSMPNALVTYNKFWNSVGTADDQAAIVVKLFGANWLGDNPMVQISPDATIDVAAPFYF